MNGPDDPNRFVLMSQAIAEAEAANNPRSIVILPPDQGDQPTPSDEEDSDIDELIEVAGEVELDCGDESSVDNETVSEESHQFSKSKTLPAFQDAGDLRPDINEDSPFKIWSLIFDNEIFQLICDQSLLYAHRDKNDLSFRLDLDEIYKFLGILILSGYHTLPSERHYWSTQKDLGVPIVSDSMTRNRFQKIKSFIHLADNQSLTPGNKLAKVQPMYDLMNRNLLKFGIFHQELSIDESIVPYYGKHGCKMYMKAKPIRFGFKLWTLCGANGYPYQFQIYAGKSAANPQMPLGFRIVNEMISVVASKSDVKNHEFYFDNFFTSYRLMSELSERNVKATGTIRENRLGGALTDLVSTKDLRKRERGDFDYTCDGKVHVSKWHDNSIVHVASTHLSHEPLKDARRWGKRGLNAVPQPFSVHKYNQGMGGVDLFDRLLSSYRPIIRSKKWWWPLFSHCLNASIIAAWLVHSSNTDGEKKSHLDFRRQIALTLLKSVPRPSTRNGRNVPLPDDVRFDGENHAPVSTKQGRCVVCRRNTRLRCGKCDVRLHHDKGIGCFAAYHAK